MNYFKKETKEKVIIFNQLMILSYITNLYIWPMFVVTSLASIIASRKKILFYKENGSYVSYKLLMDYGIFGFQNLSFLYFNHSSTNFRHHIHI